MRICLYTETALPQVGGQEVVVDTLARIYQRLGHVPIVLAPMPHSGYDARDEQLPYLVVRHPRFISSRYFVSWYRRFLLRLWQRRPCDILHCHGLFPPGYLGALTRERIEAPVVLTSHGGDLHENNIRLCKRGVEAKIIQGLQAADALIAISRYTRQGYRRLWPTADKIVEIPNGVDVQEFTTPVPRPANWDASLVPGRYILFLGRLHNRKGVDLLLRALATVPDNGKAQLVIAGDGPERSALEAMAGRLGIARRVRFLGGVAGAYKNFLLQNALCGVIPSRTWEAFGLVVLEMFATGTPVIATRLAGLKDLIDEGRTGWLVPPESPEAIGKALLEALTNPAATMQRGAAARRVAAQFDWNAIAVRHLELYADLAARHNRPPEVRYARVRVDGVSEIKRQVEGRASEHERAAKAQ